MESTMNTESETIYRCEKCGKWSHAKRKPKWHQRFVYDEPENLEDIISEEDPFGEEISSGWFVKCGPFSTWYAAKEI